MTVYFWLDGPMTLDECRRRFIARTLVHTGGNASRAARILGIDKRTIYRAHADLIGPSRVRLDLPGVQS